MLESTSLVLTNPEKFREAMTTAGLSNRTLALAAGLSPSRVGQLAVGHVPGISASKAVAIAAALDVDVASMFSFPDGEALVRLGLIRAV